MFDVYCPQHRSRVLLGTRSIESIDNTPAGVVVRWRCRCGARGTDAVRSKAASVSGPARSTFSAA